MGLDWHLITTIVAAIAGLTSTILTVFRFWPEARKMRAEASSMEAQATKLKVETEMVRATISDQITETALDLLSPLRAEIVELRTKLKERENELARLRSEMAEMRELNESKDRRIAELEHEIKDLRARLSALNHSQATEGET